MATMKLILLAGAMGFYCAVGNQGSPVLADSRLGLDLREGPLQSSLTEAKRVQIEERTVDANSILEADIPSHAGEAVWLIPVLKTDLKHL